MFGIILALTAFTIGGFILGYYTGGELMAQEIEKVKKRIPAASQPLMLPPSPPPAPPPSPPLVLDMDAVCQYCGCKLDGRIIICPKCNTPHHADCWADNGEKCTTYGCGLKASPAKTKVPSTNID